MFVLFSLVISFGVGLALPPTPVGPGNVLNVPPLSNTCDKGNPDYYYIANYNSLLAQIEKLGNPPPLPWTISGNLATGITISETFENPHTNMDQTETYTLDSAGDISQVQTMSNSSFFGTYGTSYTLSNGQLTIVSWVNTTQPEHWQTTVVIDLATCEVLSQANQTMPNTPMSVIPITNNSCALTPVQQYNYLLQLILSTGIPVNTPQGQEIIISWSYTSPSYPGQTIYDTYTLSANGTITFTETEGLHNPTTLINISYQLVSNGTQLLITETEPQQATQLIDLSTCEVLNGSGNFNPYGIKPWPKPNPKGLPVPQPVSF